MKLTEIFKTSIVELKYNGDVGIQEIGRFYMNDEIPQPVKKLHRALAEAASLALSASEPDLARELKDSTFYLVGKYLNIKPEDMPNASKS